MSSIWGNNVKISIFGESHSKAIGVNIDGLPPGYEINLDEINHQLSRRKSINFSISTERQESDNFKILSGYYNNKTTGTPLCGIFQNNDVYSSPYEKNKHKPRPGTADFTSYIRYDGFNDFRGGGHNSARLTAGLVFAGNICYQILKKKYNIVIGSHISRIYNKKSNKYLNKSNIDVHLLHKLSLEYFPVIVDNDKKEYIELLQKFKQSGNTVGGEIEVGIVGLPAGIGCPIFDSLESKISSLLFSIPSVKIVDFGLGITEMDGISAKDEFYYDKNLKIKTKMNNNCGILGGISSGNSIIYRIGFKPIASIYKPQNTIDLKTQKNTTIKIEGRHDVCPVVRAAPIVEGISAIAILDAVYDKYK